MPAKIKKAWVNMITGGNFIVGSSRVIAPKNSIKTFTGSNFMSIGSAITNNFWSATNTLDADLNDQNTLAPVRARKRRARR